MTLPLKYSTPQYIHLCHVRMSVTPPRMTDFSSAHGILCYFSNPIVIYSCDGTRQGKLITRSIVVISVANTDQLCWPGKIDASQVLQLVFIETNTLPALHAISSFPHHTFRIHLLWVCVYIWGLMEDLNSDLDSTTETELDSTTTWVWFWKMLNFC